MSGDLHAQIGEGLKVVQRFITQEMRAQAEKKGKRLGLR